MPHLTDETAEALRAFAISQGRIAPLTNVDPYIGPHLDYLLAGLFTIFGPDPLLPRILSMVCGVLTVLAAERLAMVTAEVTVVGTETTGSARLAGLLAGLMVALNPVHVVVNSHVAWSHATTPLWSTAGLWALFVGVEQRRGGALAWAGVLLGLAIASHPTSALLVAGAAGYALWRGRSLLKTPWPWLALGLLILVNMPLIAYNLQSHGGSFTRAQAVMAEYARGQTRGATAGWYLASLGRQAIMLAQMLAGPLDLRPPTMATVTDPWLVGYAIVALAGFATALRRRCGLLLLLPCLALFTGIAYLNTSQHEPVTDSRYLVPMLPLIAAAIGSLAADLLAASRQASVRVGIALLAIALTVLPLLHLVAYLERAAAEEPNDASMLAEVRRILSVAGPGDVVLLDAQLDDVAIRSHGPTDEGMRYRAIRYGLTLADVPFTTLPVELDALPILKMGGADVTGRLVVLSTETTRGRTPGGLRASGLRSPDGRPLAAPSSAVGFAVYRVEPPPHPSPDTASRRSPEAPAQSAPNVGG